MTVIKCIFLIAALFGYRLFYKTWKLSDAFFPVLFLSFCSVFLYLVGLITSLKIGYLAILILGVFFLLVYRKDISLSQLSISVRSPVFLLMTISVLWAFIITRTADLSYADDYTHWFRVCKVLHDDALFPRTPELIHISYCPGTAVVICFITEIIGFEARNCLFVQCVMNASCVCALLAACEKKSVQPQKRITVVLTGIAGIILCGAGYGTYELMVDTIMPLVGVAGFALVFFEKKSIFRDAGIILILTFCSLIKLPALLFTVLVGLYILATERKEKKNTLFSILAIAVPAVISSLYMLRNRIVLGNIDMGLHAFSLSRYIETFREKSWEWIGEIARNYLKSYLDLKSPQVLLLFLTVIGFILYGIISKKWKVPVFGLASILAYQFMLLVVYLVDMSPFEASYIAVVERYIASIDVFGAGILACAFLMETGSAITIAGAVVFAGMLFVNPPGYLLGEKYYKPIYSGFPSGMSKRLISVITPATEYNEKSYLVVWNPDEKEEIGSNVFNVMGYATESYMRTHNVEVVTYEELERRIHEENWLHEARKFDYVIVFGQDVEKAQLLEEVFGIPDELGTWENQKKLAE